MDTRARCLSMSVHPPRFLLFLALIGVCSPGYAGQGEAISASSLPGGAGWEAARAEAGSTPPASEDTPSRRGNERARRGAIRPGPKPRPDQPGGAGTQATALSLSNKVLEVRVIEGNLVLTLATDIYATQFRDTTRNLRLACNENKSVVFPANTTTPTEREMIRQAALAARLAPFRARFTVVQDECVEVPGEAGSTFPVATRMTISSVRPGP